MKEVAFLKEKLAKADKDKTEVGETWKKRLQETESKKAEEIAELKVRSHDFHWNENVGIS